MMTKEELNKEIRLMYQLRMNPYDAFRALKRKGVSIDLLREVLLDQGDKINGQENKE